jgi:hypothetical protein
MAEKPTAEKTAAPVDEAAEAQEVDGVTLAATAEKKPAGTKAYRSDRNLAEVNEGEVVYLDAKSDVGKRLLATGYFEEVDDPQA